MARLTLTLLGAFEARLGPAGTLLTLPRKTQALVAYLALAQRPVTRAELASLLWGETGRAQAQQSLRQTLSGLRQSLGRADALLQAESQSVSLERAQLDVDSSAFEALVRKGDAQALADAGALYRGEFLAGLDLDEGGFEDWLLAQRERLREMAMNALTQLLARPTGRRSIMTGSSPQRRPVPSSGATRSSSACAPRWTRRSPGAVRSSSSRARPASARRACCASSPPRLRSAARA